MCSVSVHCYWLFGLTDNWSNICSCYELNLSCTHTLIDFTCLFWTEIFGYIRRTLFSDDGVPNADMRAVGNDEFKAVGELMACSLIQGGPAPCFLSVNVYDYVIDGMASVQSEKWASLIKDDFLRQSVERVQFSLLCIMFKII